MKVAALFFLVVSVSGCGSSNSAPPITSLSIVSPVSTPIPSPSSYPSPTPSPAPLSCTNGEEKQDGNTIEVVNCTGASLGALSAKIDTGKQFQLLENQTGCDPIGEENGACRWTFIIGNNMSAGTCIVAFVNSTDGIGSQQSQEACGNDFNQTLDILMN